MGLYLGIWRYASLHEILSIIKSVIISTLILLGLFFLIFRLENIPRSFPILLFLTSIISVVSPRVIYRIIKDNLKKEEIKKVPILVVGDDSNCENFIRLSKQNDSPYKVEGLISTKEKTVGRRIHNIPILCSLVSLGSLTNQLKKLKKHHKELSFLIQKLIQSF